jgi:hypothetical protein
MLESIYAEAFIDSTLKNDSTLVGATALNSGASGLNRPDRLIFRNRARQGTTDYPLIIYSIQSAVDYNGQFNQFRLLAEYVFQVRTVGKVIGIDLQNASRVRATSNRADEVLKEIRDASMVLDSVTYHFNVWRESELPVREEEGEDASTFYRNYGGLYKVQVFS